MPTTPTDPLGPALRGPGLLAELRAAAGSQSAVAAKYGMAPNAVSKRVLRYKEDPAWATAYARIQTTPGQRTAAARAAGSLRMLPEAMRCAGPAQRELAIAALEAALTDDEARALAARLAAR